MSYPCPYKGTAQGIKLCERDADSIRGWKRHMTKQHGRYDDSQLAAIVGAAPTDSATGRSLFLAEATEIPGTAEGVGPNAQSGETTANPTQGSQPSQEPAPKKRVKFKPKAMREFLSGLPEMFFKAKGIETDDADKKLLDAASEMMEELFGVSIEVPDTEWVITSRWVALLFPFAAILVVWGKHTFTMEWFKKKDEGTEAQAQEQRAAD